MKLSDIFPFDNIVPDLAGTQRDEVIRDLIRQLCASGSLTEYLASDAEHAILRREDLGSTGIGKGVAVPHAKHAGVKGVIGAFGRSVKGVEFDAIDGQPVHLVFLLLGSPDAVEPHIAALRKITTLLKDGDICIFMQRAKDRDELSALIGEADERMGD